MKNILKVWAALFVAASMSACVAEMKESLDEDRGIGFSIGEVEMMEDYDVPEDDAGEVETRTTFTTPSGTSYPVLWTGNEKVEVCYYSAAQHKHDLRSWTVTASSDHKTASIRGTQLRDLDQCSNYYFYLASPSSCAQVGGWGVGGVDENTYGLTLKVPVEQTPLTSSPDEAAQILGAKAGPYTKAPATVRFSPKHLTAYVKLTLTNASSLGTLQSVTLTSTKPLSGVVSYDINATTISPYGSNTSTSVTAKTSRLSNIWFACVPAQIAGTKLTIKAVGSSKTLTREITVPSGKNLTAGKIASLSVNMNPTVAVTGVSVSPTTLTLEKGKTSTLTATVTPSNATDKTVTWSSSNTSVATVTSAGVVKGVAAGSATITATTNDGGKKATCAVTVTAPKATKVEILSKNSTLYEDGMLHITPTNSPSFDYRITYSDGTVVNDAEGTVSVVSGTSVTIQGNTFIAKSYPTSADNASSYRTTIRVKSTRTPSVYDDIVIQTWATPTGVETWSTYSFEDWLKEGTTQTYRAYQVLPAGARQKIKIGTPSNTKWTVTQTGDHEFSLKAPMVNGTTVAAYQNQNTTIKISPWHASSASLTQTFKVSNIEVREPKPFDFVAYNTSSKKNKVFDGGLRILIKTSTARDYQIKEFYCEDVSLYIPPTGFKVVGIVTTTFSGTESDQPVTDAFVNTSQLNGLTAPDAHIIINGNRIHGFAIAMYNAVASYWSRYKHSAELAGSGWWPTEINAYNSTRNCCYLFYGNSSYSNMLQGYSLTACAAYFNGRITSSDYCIYPVDRVWRYGEPGIEYSLNVLPKSYPSATPTSDNPCSFVMRPWFVPTITNWQNIMMGGKLYNTAVMQKINAQIEKAGFGDKVFPYSTDRYWTINTVPGSNDNEPQAYEVYANGFGPQEKTTESGVRPFMIF